MESFKRFGMLALFLAYLLFQVDNSYAEGIVELNREEAETIKKLYSNKIVDESDLVPTRLSKIEKWIAGIKDFGIVEKFKSGYDYMRSKVKSAYLSIMKNLKGADYLSDGSQPASKSRFSEFLNEVKHKVKDEMKDFKAIFPGTRWCGDGNKASKYEDLGLFKKTDACCRQHDECPLVLRSGEKMGPLFNNAGFTRSWCACDQDFYNCLKDANQVVAREIGMTFFTALRPQCIDYTYPSKCTQKTRFFGTCLKYEYDESQEKVLQWKDSPTYSETLNKLSQ